MAPTATTPVGLTFPEFMEAVQVIYERLDSLLAGTSQLTRRNALTLQAARQVVSEAEAALESLRQIRLDLDTTDTATWVYNPTDPQQFLEYAILERTLRAALGRVSGQLQSLRDGALAFAEGSDYVEIVANDEDTLQSIAQTRLGDWRRYPELLDANPEMPVDEVSAGTVVQVPTSAPGLARSRIRVGR